MATDRAWWDTSKGSAIVVWAPGDQSMAQSLSIALASIRGKSGSKRAGRPPYTVLVVLPSASWGLSSLISSWATKKARIESGKEALRGRASYTSWDFFGMGSVSVRLDSPESQSSDLAAGGPSSSDEGAEIESSRRVGERSPPPTTGKRRKLSFGGWRAPDVVGYGKDMLKGLQIGQTESPGIGAVIPVVADTSTPDGINHAYSTIRAYCTSHDLLLRALVVLPSVMSATFASPLTDSSTRSTSRILHTSEPRHSSSSSRSREVTRALETDELLHRVQAAGPSSLSNRSLYSTQAALATDVGQAMNVVASLVPALQTDGGRVIAVVPCAFRPTEAKSLSNNKDGGIEENDGLEFNVTRIAMLEMWSRLRKRLASEGVQVSQIHMSTPPRTQSLKSTKQQRSSITKQGSVSSIRILARYVISETHSIIYSMPTKIESQKSTLQDDDDDGTDTCPFLFLDAIRSVLVRSWPRAHYSVGLGPRLEDVWECIPWHQSMLDWIQTHV